MRIVAGEFRGRNVAAPEGPGTRPTIDRVRESLYSMLYSKLGGFGGTVALDAFAGSGALGLEALSRGADSVVFYDCDAQAARVLQRNLDAFGLKAPRAVLRRADVLASPPLRPARKFSLLLLDPPYAKDPVEIGAFVESLRRAGALEPEAIICYEHAAKADVTGFLPQGEECWVHIDERKYGKVGVSLFQLA